MGRHTQIQFEDNNHPSSFSLDPEFRGRLLDVHDIAKILKVSYRTIQGWTTKPDRLPKPLVLKGSRLRRWSPNVVQDWINEGLSNPKPKGPGRPRKGV